MVFAGNLGKICVNLMAISTGCEDGDASTWRRGCRMYAQSFPPFASLFFASPRLRFKISLSVDEMRKRNTER